MAAQQGYKKMVQMFLDKGADKTVTVNGMTPAMIAEAMGHVDVKFIIQEHESK
jgi:ankyrin repeat protein